MSLYVIGDLHLSLGSNKPMDIFGGWHNYLEKLEENWRRLVRPEDGIVLAGDSSWGMTLEESLRDFQYLQGLPGRKYLIKGNHDYWWGSARKMQLFFEENGLDSLKILHNNCAEEEGLILCGTRGWLFENGAAFDQKIVNREAGRLEMSLKASQGMEGERVVFLHYPPLFGDQVLPEFIDLMEEWKVRRCYYGHLHGNACRIAFNGSYRGIRFQLVSADGPGFCPLLVPAGKSGGNR